MTGEELDVMKRQVFKIKVFSDVCCFATAVGFLFLLKLLCDAPYSPVLALSLSRNTMGCHVTLQA